MKIAIYLRELKNSEKTVESKKRQFSNSVASYGECEIADFYVDTGCSGIDINRPEYQRMINDAKNKKFDYIVIEFLGKLSRNTITTISEINKLKEIGIGVYAMNNVRDYALDSLSPKWIEFIKYLQEDVDWHLNRTKKAVAKQKHSPKKEGHN